MKPVILLTGANGCVGRAVVERIFEEHAAAELVLLIRPGGPALPPAWRAMPVQIVEGDITLSSMGVPDSAVSRWRQRVNTVIHAAADTRLTASYETLQRANVTGTGSVLAFARRCARLEKFIHISTTCVAGKRMGSIPEAPLSNAGFVNAYEQTKWEAEQLVLRSGLPSQIVRLATVVGSERDGRIARWGAAHLTLYFLYRGLVPMVPGQGLSTVDFISSELAARIIVTASLQAGSSVPVLHVSATPDTAPLSDFLDFTIERFRRVHAGWRRGAFSKPPIVDERTFGLFQNSVALSRDLLFNQVLACTESFLPGLLHPKTYSTACARELLGGPLPIVPWHQLAGAVIDHCLATNWSRGMEDKPDYECADSV